MTTRFGIDERDSKNSSLICSPTRLAAAVKGLPPDWPKRNLQLVIHARVISGEAAMPRVVASYVW